MSNKTGESPRLERHELRSVVRSDAREDLRRYLDASDEPLSSRELAKLLGISECFVAYMLMDSVRSGRITKVADGRYESHMPPFGAEVADLLEFVLYCEANWRLSDRLGL